MSRLGAYELMTRIAAHHGWTIEPEEMEPERVVLLLRVVQCWIGVSTATAEHNLAYLVAGRIEDDGNVTPPVVEGVARCDQVDSVLDAADDLMRHLVANSRAQRSADSESS